MEKIELKQYYEDIDALAEKIKARGKKYSGLYGVPRGGYLPAIRLSGSLNLPIVTDASDNTLIVDDIVDSGKTLSRYPGNDTAVVYAKSHSKEIANYYGAIRDGWLLIPDEQECGIEEHIRRILEYIGENPNREGLIGTPDRIVRMWGEIFRGYDKAKAPKVTTFQNGSDGLTYDNMVVDTGDFYSCCEHHMMPFFGHYWFAYIPHPKGKILGISKIGRVVDYCAAKLQIQERLVSDIASVLLDALGTEYPPLGIAIVMKAEHLCKSMRGAKKKGTMTSSFLMGAFRDDTAVRTEFMNFVNSK